MSVSCRWNSDCHGMGDSWLLVLSFFCTEGRRRSNRSSNPSSNFCRLSLCLGVLSTPAQASRSCVAPICDFGSGRICSSDRAAQNKRSKYSVRRLCDCCNHFRGTICFCSSDRVSVATMALPTLWQIVSRSLGELFSRTLPLLWPALVGRSSEVIEAAQQNS